ncbi:MAG: hypothetical protein ACI8TS_001484 [Flavobacteriales bacterium]
MANLSKCLLGIDVKLKFAFMLAGVDEGLITHQSVMTIKNLELKGSNCRLIETQLELISKGVGKECN